ncbi:hypothetical protein L7F22_024476 [Adiantum nelumboides]|nr:hypothetical protein [Adiantum nelumboides]
MGQARENVLANWLLLTLVVCACGHIKGTNATWLSLINTCKQPVWPASQPMRPGIPVLGNGSDGFELPPRERRTLELPATWAGRIWGRTGCNFSNLVNGTYNCLAGECGVGCSMQCDWWAGVPPVTVFYLNLAGSYNGDQDIYDVSLEDGFNLPMVALPAHGTSGNCLPTGCNSKAHCFSYAYDDSINNYLTCANPKGYYVTFCPK